MAHPTRLSRVRVAPLTSPGVAGFRGDIDGLRAVAIVAVVAFHARVPGFSGGFVGVDVFFVISGYLITRKLLAEADLSGSVHLGRFWAGRVRRLVPAMSLMVVVTFLLAFLILSPIEWGEVARQGGYASLYVSNIAFAEAATDYFAADIGQSLFLHTWSLSLEEQFYLLWPLVTLVATLRVSRARSVRARLAGLYVAILAISFGLNLWMVTENGPWAFFGLPTRAWEFAGAGLLALAPLPRWLGGRARLGMAAIGSALIAWAIVALDQTDAYPGYRALLPVAGTVLVIAAGAVSGSRSNPISWLLSTAPLRWLGRVSYSWYLWHWPLMLLLVAAVDSDTLAIRLGGVLLALGVAVIAYTVVENPIRFSGKLRASTRLSLMAGLGLTGAALMGTVVLATLYRSAIQESPYREIVAVRAESTDLASRDCPDPSRSPNGIQYCLRGDPDASELVMLVGDSHAGQWSDVLAQAAERLGVRFVEDWSLGCPAIEVRRARSGAESEMTECDAIRSETRALIDDLEPDAVVVSHFSRGYQLLDDRGRSVGGSEAVDLWGDAYLEFLDRMDEAGVSIGALVDNPRVPFDPLFCIARAQGDVRDCPLERQEALRQQADYLAAESAALESRGSPPTFGVTDDICPTNSCHLLDGGIYTFVDSHHLSAAFVQSKRDGIEDFLASILAASR